MLRFPANPTYGQVFIGARRTWVYRESFWDVMDDNDSNTVASTLTKNVITVGPVAPTGAIDSENTEFVLDHFPLTETLRVYYNGLLQKRGEIYDYTKDEKTISFLDPPHPGSTITVVYDRLSSIEVMGEVPDLDVCHCEGMAPKYHLDYLPETSSIMLYLNGLLKKINEDYTVNGNDITFTYVFPPEYFIVQVYYRVNL